MDINLIENIKQFLSKNDLDGLLINSTNEFLVEYNKLENNSRYYITDFTGSTGDVLFLSTKIYLFVDTRYHEQADNQVDKTYIEVIKIPLGESYINMLADKIPAYCKIGIVSKKTSKLFYDKLIGLTQNKNITFKLLNSDPVIEYKKDSIKTVNYDVFSVSNEITGVSPDEKFEYIKQFAGNKFNVLITSLEDIAYLTNLRSYNFDYSAIFPIKAIMTEEEVKLYSDCKLPEIGSKFKVCPFCEFENALKKIEKQEIYIDESLLTLFDYNLINKSNKILKSHLNLFKTIKNENEILHLKKCFERADNALKIIYEMINSDQLYSEYDYYEALIKSMKENGALSLSFKPIVAAGKNSSIIHYSTPSKEKLVADGDFLLIDYGGYYEGGLATDTTRTFLKGEADEDQKIAYTTVLKAFLNTYYNKYNKKSTYFDIDKIARETIEKSISKEYAFAHSTGHGVGICVHENPPRVSSGKVSKTKILENSVFSVEPGVYKEGWGGIRLENTVYATMEDDKIVLKSFSHFPFEIKLVDLTLMNDYEKYYYMKWQANACLI